MANIFDYLDWRDIELNILEFNEIDNLILSRLSYFPFDGIINDNEEITIKEAYSRYKKIGNKGKILQAEDTQLFPKLANSIRFGNMKLTQFINKIDLEQEKQFAAISIIMPDNTIYVSFRGTDNTIVGWKEDFNMSFSDLIPAQVDSVKYLENIAKLYKNKLRVGGHSKGGNLAVYASAFCNIEIQKRIIKVYNNDGPGFGDKVINSEEYKNIIDKVHTYIPQTSIIGRLLNHKEKTIILKSTQTGIMQHDLYTWQVLGDKFVRDELTDSSQLIDKTVTDWIREVSKEQREEFFNTLFEILNATEAETLSDIKGQWFKNSITMIDTYKNLDQRSREIMKNTLSSFLKIGKGNIDIPKINFKKVKM